MTSAEALEIEELRRRLAAAEATARTRASGEGEAVVAQAGGASPVILVAAQNALRDREQLFRAVFDGALDAMVLTDGAGKYVDANPAATALFGLPRDELLGLDASAFSEATLDVDATREEFLRRGHLEGRFVITRKDGTQRDTDFQATANILPGLHLSTLRDMTERRLAESRFRALIEGSTDVVVLSLEDTTIVYTSPSVTAVLGYGPNELGGTKLVDLLLPDDAAVLLAKRRSLVDDPDRISTLQFRVRHRDGSTRWIESTARNLLDDPSVRAFVSTFRDITDRTKAHETHARLAAVVEFSDHAIIAGDLAGRITSWNRAAERLLGYTSVEIVGQSIGLLMPSDRANEGRYISERIALGHTVENLETFRRRKDGTIVEVSLTAAPLRDVEERVVGFTKIARDLTSQRRSEEVLRRTAHQLQQAQKMEAVGRLAAGVAHDFNNVLSVILSYSALVLQDISKDQPIYADIEEIRRAGERAAGLTHQLLAFSRQQVLEPRVLDLNETLEGMQKMLQRLLGEDIELTLFTSRAIGRINADPGQIGQVIMNLAVNARDAMPTGGKLSIETSNVDLDAAYVDAHVGAVRGSYVMLALTDSGAGMDAATRAQIFDPFFTTKERGKGTGLGLSMVLGIVAQSGGHVTVYSEPGTGTTFKVYLPRTDQAAATDASPPEVLTLKGSETILLVEDEEQVRELVGAILRRSGYHVLEAPNGDDALVAAERNAGTIDIVVTDVVMPRMSGRQLVERLAPSRPEMKVLFMSGYTDDAIVHHGVLTAGVAFVQKPITPDALLRKVREVLDSPNGFRGGSLRPSP